MSDEVRATNFDCCDHSGCGDNNWIEWIVIIFVIFFLLGDNNIFGRRGCCR